MKQINIFNLFRKVAFVEGVSYLVLLFIAMPLKYMAKQAAPVKIVGSIHGVLFVAFAIALLAVIIKYKKNLFWAAKAFVASLIPFGTFYMDKEWKEEEINRLN